MVDLIASKAVLSFNLLLGMATYVEVDIRKARIVYIIVAYGREARFEIARRS